MLNLKLTCYLALLLVCVQGYAQKSPLKIGEQLPDLNINRILYRVPGEAKLSDFAGKLIILDFWSMSCSTCIEDMPKMDSLQKHFGDKIAILPIYPAEEAFSVKHINTIDSFWHAKPKLFKTSLTPIMDGKFASYFPVRVAYQIWIDGNRTIRAITSPEYVNKHEIEKMLKGRYSDWESEIKEFSYGKSVSEYLVRPEFSELKDQNYSFFTSYLKGIDTSMDKDTSDSLVLVSYKNAPILSFYRSYLAANKVAPENTVMEVTDSTRYFKKGYGNEWLKNNSYCYELKLNRMVGEKELADYIRQDANKYFSLNTRFEHRNISCLILKKIKNGRFALKRDYKRKMSMYEFYDQVRFDQNLLWEKGERSTPVLRDKNLKSTTELKFPELLDFTDLAALRKVLQNQGYDLVKEKRWVKAFVLSEIK